MNEKEKYFHRLWSLHSIRGRQAINSKHNKYDRNMGQNGGIRVRVVRLSLTEKVTSGHILEGSEVVRPQIPEGECYRQRKQLVQK